MTDINLERVSPHDDDECAAGLNRLRSERDLARRIAVSLEQECAELERRLVNAHTLNSVLVARLQTHGIALPGAGDMASSDGFGSW